MEHSPLGSRELNRLQRLEREREELVEACRRREDHLIEWKKTRSTLEHLIREFDVHEALRNLGHPFRILGGDIDLDRADQKNALAELSVTLGATEKEGERLSSVLRAVQLYYQRFFKDGEHPERSADQEGEALKAFDADAERGALPAFAAFTDWQKVIAGKSPTPPAQDWPTYAPILVAAAIPEMESQPDRQRWFEITPWDSSHLHLLKRLFESETSAALAEGLLGRILEGSLQSHVAFLERQIQRDHHLSLIRSRLEVLKREESLRLRDRALDDGAGHLLGLLTDFTGVDQPLYYQALKKRGLVEEVFSRLVNLLFSNPSSGHYGMDPTYATEVLKRQKNWPKKIISVLQGAMPRGLEGQTLDDALTFFEGLVERKQKLLEDLAALGKEELSGKEQCEIQLSLSDLETARFILFTYIHDRIVSSAGHSRAIGLHLGQLSERLESIRLTELQVGANRNVLEHIESLCFRFPALRPIQKTEA